MVNPEIPQVLHVIAPAPIGGAESVVRGMAVESCRRGAGVGIAALLQGAGLHPFGDLDTREDGLVVEVRCGRRRYGSEVRELSGILQARGVQVVHTHVYHGDFVGYWAARRCSLPVVATVHGFTHGALKNRFYQWADLRLLRRFDAVICVSGPIRKRLLVAGVPAGKTHLVPNGYVPERFLSPGEARKELGLGPEETVIGWIGRLSHEKGPDLLIDAVAGLPLPRPVCVVIGDGPERHHIGQRIARRGLTGRDLRLAGPLSSAARLLKAFDVLVLSSRTEGVPMVLLEAMAAGVPVVGFAVGGIPDVVDESSASLVAPEDVRGLTRAIAAVLASPELAQRRTRTAAAGLA